MKYFLLQIFFLMISNCLHAEQCLTNIGAFDIGSGTTKMKVAKVDVCKKKIIKILYKESMPVGYKESIYFDKLSKQSLFSKNVMEEGFKVLKQLKKRAAKYGARSFLGVATSAFRTVKNSKSFIERINRELSIKVSIITQRQEGEIGFLAANAYRNFQVEPIVWDIGGGSTQIITKVGDKLHFYGGEMGAVSFKKRVIKDLLGHDPSKIKSPNPLGKINFLKAVDLASKFARNSVSKKIISLIKEGKMKVIGIGGVHNFSIMGQLKAKKFYTLTNLFKVALSRVKLTDKEIKGKYFDTEITNLAFVIGFMKELQIERIQTEKVDLTDGLLSNPFFFK